jgi:RNA polymerase sigma-70 factor (ECF subfamily)
VTWLQPFPDAYLEDIEDNAPGPGARYVGREAVALAFITGLQLLPPRQAAAVVLRDVLCFSAAEVADMIGTSTTGLKGVLQRARASLDRHRAAEAPPPPGSAAERELAQRFADAFTAGDVDGVIGLLTDDAWLSMPPAPQEYRGIEAIAAFLGVSTAWRGDRPMRLVSTRVNGQPAFGYYLAGDDGAAEFPPGLTVLTLRGDRIRAIVRFLETGSMRRFGLPDAMT